MHGRIIHLADCPPQPWKNGLGRTREIAVHTSAADSERFVWRVSVAEVDSAAPFSTFSGVDRHIVLLGRRRFHDPTTVLVFCARGMIDIADGRLHAGDAWRPSPHTVASLTLRDGALALVVRIEPHAI